MSELIMNSSDRKTALEDFTLRLLSGENGKMLMEKHQQVLGTVTPFETMQVLDALLLAGMPVDKVKAGVGKILNAFHKSLSSHQWEKPGKGHFIHYLMLENREAEKILDEIKTLNKSIFKGRVKEMAELTSRLRLLMLTLKEYELHYIKKENILFPYIEKVFPEYRCLQIMWSFHDDFRETLKQINRDLEDANPDYDILNKLIGKLFFIILPVIFREEQIVFPVALKAVPEKAWNDMMAQSIDTGWCYIDIADISTESAGIPSNSGGLIDLGSGLLSIGQVRTIFNNLPLDITFIDENDEVKFFSESQERIFPRSRAIIGRKVQNCHPPQSIHVVNEILAAFRKGERDSAEFWIQMNGRFIYIRYFALRNEAGEYRGTIEASEDITVARSLAGERRLLKWNTEK
ncbi:MAG TPA: PAS domain-containing protein [Bacteroidales bacterium]|nr:PAS domain-containing protein [Bacteroidales bacterium]